MMDKKEYYKQKRKIDINYRLGQNLSRRVRYLLEKPLAKSYIIEFLGCSGYQLRKYLESKFTNAMSWTNKATWEIDHIRPCASFDLSKTEEQAKCFHYTNLQPLPITKNRKKSKKLNENSYEEK